MCVTSVMVNAVTKLCRPGCEDGAQSSYVGGRSDCHTELAGDANGVHTKQDCHRLSVLWVGAAGLWSWRKRVHRITHASRLGLKRAFVAILGVQLFR